MDITALEGLFDEVIKIAASKRMASYMQSRTGTRPIRVQTLLDKENNQTQQPDLTIQEPDTQPIDKEAAEEGWQEKTIRPFAVARPYVASAAKGAVPGSIIGTVLGGGKAGKMTLIGAGVGAGLGTLDAALQKWAKDNPRQAKKALKGV